MLPPIVSLSPLRATVFGWRGAQARMLTLVCKATYTLRPVESPLADQQEDPNESDDYWDDDRERSLRAPSDLVPRKPRAEVLVVGSAFAPTGAPRARLAVRVIVGDVDKALAVIGDRAVLPDGSVPEPAPFAQMTLRYERAAGGPGTVNPVGVRGDVDATGKRMLPNIVPIDTLASSVDEMEPIGLGPIAPRWPLRDARLGPGAAEWVARGDLEVPWPDDFDASFFHTAPWDQQLDALRPNERIVLENLHPGHPRLVTNLPGIEPRVFVDDERGTPHELSMRADTLFIDTDRGICTLTWRGQLPAQHPQPARIIVASSNIGRRLAWGDVAPLAGPPSARPRRPPLGIEEFDPPTVTEMPADADEIDTTGPVREGAGGPALPFVGGRVRPAPATPSPAAAKALPFAAITAPAPVAPAPVTPAAAAASPAFLGAITPPPSAPAPAPSTPSFMAASALASAPAALGSSPARPEPPKPPRVVEAPAVAPAAEAPPAKWDVVKAAKAWAPGRAFGPPPAAAAAPKSAAPAAASTPATPASSVLSAGPDAAAASDAAAARSAPPAVPSEGKVEAPIEALAAVSPAPAPLTPQRTGDRTFVDLLWFDAEGAPRLRTAPLFKALFGDVDRGPRTVDEKVDAKELERRERRDFLRAMTGVSPVDGEPLRRVIEEQFADPATYVHPLVLVTGDLAPSFDEVATLKAAVQLGSTLGGGDKRTRDAAAVAGEALKGDPPPRETALGLARGIVDAAAKSGGPPLAPAITRLLLDQRAFRKRHLFGAPHLRMELAIAGSPPAAVYLPEAAEEKLPCLAKFRVRLLAEVRPQEDYADSASEAYVALALARVLRGG